MANLLEQEKLSGQGVALAARLDIVVLDELGYLPFSKNSAQLLFHLISKLYEQTSVLITTNLTARHARNRQAETEYSGTFSCRDLNSRRWHSCLVAHDLLRHEKA